MSIVKFSSTKLINSDKKGILKPNSQGYYTMPIGALNSFNSVGEYYTLEGAKELFEQSSSFMRRVKNSCLKGELGHPKRLPGMSDDAYVNRLMHIEETNTVCHFADIWLDTDFGKNNPQYKNKDLVAIMANVCPTGDKGEALKRSFENPNEDVCFSIRALTKDYYLKGQTYRVLNQIITFDNVTESGIATARKYDSPALETFNEQLVTKKSLERIISSKNMFVSTEDSVAMARSCLESYSEVKVIQLPIISRW